jgi:uncharacterized protein YgiM (DUF1202 family)
MKSSGEQSLRDVRALSIIRALPGFHILGKNIMRKLTIYGVIAVLLAALLVGPSLMLSTSAPVVEANAGTQWNAQYFNNINLSDPPVLTRVDDKIDFNWGAGSPDPAVNADNFSARWTKNGVNFPTAGKWTFRVGADDGVRMWIDITPIVDEWHGSAEGYHTYEVSIDTLTAGNHDLKVEYYEATGNAAVKVEWFYAGTNPPPGGGGSVANWNGSYFNNTDLSGTAALTRTDPIIDFNWGTGSPDPAVHADNFSVRWTATVNFPTAGHWHFIAGADDGIRMWIDVTQIVDEWHGNPEGYRSYSVDIYALTAGNHDLKVEYFEATGNAGVQVRWEFIGEEGTGGGGVGGTVIPPTPIPPATVYAAATADNINVRSGPGLGNPVIGRLTFEENYLVLGAVPDLSWLLIDLENGSTGWVSNEWVWLYALEPDKNQDTTGGGQPDFVDDIPRIDMPVAPPAPLPEDDSLRVTLTGRATDNLNLRDGPSLYTAKIIGSVPQSATFTVEAHNGNGAWYLINYQGIRGWVSALYVDLLDGSVSQLVASSEVVPAPPPGAIFVPQPEPGVYVVVRGQAISNLKLRDAASLRGNDIGSVPQGAEFVIEARNSTGAWYLITWEGVQGWIYSPYVTVIEGHITDLPIR